MAMTKISATLSPDVVEEVRKRAGPRGMSAWLDAAVREKLAQEKHQAAVLAMLAEFDKEDPPTEVEVQEAEDWAEGVIARLDSRLNP